MKLPPASRGSTQAMTRSPGKGTRRELFNGVRGSRRSKRFGMVVKERGLLRSDYQESLSESRGTAMEVAVTMDHDPGFANFETMTEDQKGKRCNRARS